MTVEEVIQKLQTMNPKMEVMFDATRPESEIFKFVSVDDVDEVKDPEGYKFVLMSCGLDEEDNQNFLN